MPRMPLIGVRIFVAHRGEKAGLRFVRRLGPFARGGRFLQPPDFVAQRLVLGGGRAARASALARARARGRERERQSDHRARLKPQSMNREIRQSCAQIHPQSRPARPDANRLRDPWFQAAIAIPLRNWGEFDAFAAR